MVLPGPEATQLAIYIGWLMHRSVGGILAGVLFVLPSLLVLIALSWIYMAFGNLPLVVGVLYGIKPAVVAIVMVAAWRIGRRTLKNPWLAAIALAALLAISAAHIPFPYIILGAALCGLLGGHLLPQSFALGGGNAQALNDYGPALIEVFAPRGVSYVGDGELARVCKIAHNVMLGVVIENLIEMTLLDQQDGRAAPRLPGLPQQRRDGLDVHRAISRRRWSISTGRRRSRRNCCARTSISGSSSAARWTCRCR